MTPAALTPEQTHALFDILTHHETYAEIEAFKFPDAVTSYGFPFARTTVVPQSQQQFSGWRSWSGTPVNSTPGTPRVRTPVPPAKPTPEEDTSNEGDKNDDKNDGEDDQDPSTAPISQMLLTGFVLLLPGVRDLPREFWSVRMQGILVRLGEADLSESYDKGALGTRKVLATGASVLMEIIGRGALGGLKRRPHAEPQLGAGVAGAGAGAGATETKEEVYDHTKAQDLTRAWDDVLEGLVYGDLSDKLFDHYTKTDDLEGYSPTIAAAAQYAIIHLATLIHHIFVLSPEGQYLLKLLENVHSLIPYKMVKQTLRVGNAATMISAMMRLLLAKLSVTSLTNWVGLTANADDGMNLLQRIISLTLSWDAGEFRKSADKIEKTKDRPSDEMLQAIRDHIAQGRSEHETVRAASIEHSQSIITAILNAANPELTAGLTEQKHAQCLEYYSALLSVHDRESITATLCRQPPDLFTATVKDLFTAYEPIIRSVHSQVDLREHVEAGQAFIDDFIKTSKPKKDETGTSTPLGGMRSILNSDSNKTWKMPTVDDYVELLRRNRFLLYRWIHALAKSCPEVWEEMRKWFNDAMLKFHQEEKPQEIPSAEAAKSESAGVDTSDDGKTSRTTISNVAGTSLMDHRLNELFQSLSEPSRLPVLAALDAHSSYLSTLSALSTSRLQRLIDSSNSDSNSMAGPGIYLSRWQGLIESTPITPSLPHDAVRTGKDVKHAMTMGKTVVAGADKAREAAHRMAEEGPEAPDVDVVIKELAEGFRKLLQDLGPQESTNTA